jgi:hypothetical protein
MDFFATQNRFDRERVRLMFFTLDEIKRELLFEITGSGILLGLIERSCFNFLKLVDALISKAAPDDTAITEI